MSPDLILSIVFMDGFLQLLITVSFDGEAITRVVSCSKYCCFVNLVTCVKLHGRLVTFVAVRVRRKRPVAHEFLFAGYELTRVYCGWHM